MAGELVYAREQVGWVVPESTFGTLVYPSSSHAILFEKLLLTAEPEGRKTRMDLRDTRSVRERIRGKRKASWSYAGFLRPSGSLGVAPDEGEIIKNAFGVEAVSPGVSVTYSFHKNPETVLAGLSIHRMGGHFAEAVRGALVDSLSFKAAGDGEAMIEAEGVAVDHIHTGSSVLAASAAGGASSIQVTANDRAKFMAGSRVDVGTSQGHVISGPSDAYGYLNADVLNVAPTISGTQGIGLAVVPNVPGAVTVAGNPVAGVFGSVTINGVALVVLSFTVTVQTGYRLREKEYGALVPTRFLSPAQRGVEIEVEVFLTKDQFKYFGQSKMATVHDCALVAGAGAGTRATLNADRVEFDVPGIEPSEDDETTMVLKGIARSDGTAENELSLVFD